MFSILPCKDEAKLKAYPQGTTLLIYKEDGKERGHIAYVRNKSAFEILSMDTGVKLSGDGSVSNEMFLHADALIRSIGAIALGEGSLTLCTKDDSLESLWKKFGFFKHNEYYTLYLSRLFAKGCSGCEGCNGCK
ncbi:MAG: hypothetical protein E7566_04735 [Ruminococcaceae bacterium]|nr:hypothetical protein [Oscillospiraceae bacterium]